MIVGMYLRHCTYVIQYVVVVFINNFNPILAVRVQFAKLDISNNRSCYAGKSVILIRDALTSYLDLPLGCQAIHPHGG